MAQKWFMLALLAVLAATTADAATNHVVGGSTGWTIPSSASLYSQWASSQTFTLGDSLLFNFTTGLHNVVEVPKSSYDSCSPSNAIGSILTAGPATVTLAKPGSHYFICGVSGHCNTGQKLAVNVAPAASPSRPSPAPSARAPPHSSPAPAPATSPAPATAPAAPSPTPAPAPAASAPATAPATSSPTPTPAPSASAPAAGPPAPSGPAAGPTSSSTPDSQNPTAAAGPAGGGPGTSSATSLSLASGYWRTAGIAALLSATAAFLL